MSIQTIIQILIPANTSASDWENAATKQQSEKSLVEIMNIWKLFKT